MSSTSKFKFIPLKIQGAYIVECDRYHDNRGFFQELYRDTRYENVVHGARQISFSASKKNVVRGIHCSQYGKLVTCVKGKIIDFCVDMRKESQTYLQWLSIELSGDSSQQIFIPPRCGHAFFGVEEENLVVYSQESVFHPPAEMYVNWLDPTIGIQWPLGNDPSAYVISEQDKKAPFLNEALQQWIERNNRSQF